MKNLNLLLVGCNGNMGKEVIKASNNTKDSESTCVFQVICGYDKEDTGLYDFPVYTDLENVEKLPDIIMDFSVPTATLKALEFAKKQKIPIVIATTGFSDEEFNEIEKASKEIPIFQSFNMSFDIFLMQKIAKMISPSLQNVDIEIIETHHNKKIDAPSGTALMLADSINSVCDGKYSYNFNRVSSPNKRKKYEIGFSSIRGGNIVGEHEIKFIGPNDTFQMKHTSYSRQIFAEGAFKAAEFLIDKPAGFYHMDDLD